MEDPGGSEGSAGGGWAFRFERGEKGDRFKLDQVMASDALLLGRRTFEGFAEAWPSREGDFADKFNGMQTYVVSSTLGEPQWNNSKVIRGNIASEIQALRDAPGGDLLVNGSSRLVSLLLEQRLIDELRLMVYPIVLGRGKRLFPEGSESSALRLIESRTAGEAVILIYVPK
jgi:dihydrofolate reductase